MTSRRDPRRIKPILELLEAVWRQHPDYRLGQLVSVVAGHPDAVSSTEDDQMRRTLALLRELGESRNPTRLIGHLAGVAQRLVDARFEAVGGNPVPGTALDQAGLRDGRDTVLDYLEHNEAGLAFEHVEYMLDETGVELSPHDEQLRRRVRAMFKGRFASS